MQHNEWSVLWETPNVFLILSWLTFDAATPGRAGWNP
jgi:hypothetical protein